MVWEVVVSAGFGAAIGISLVAWLGKNWVLTRLKASIQHEYAIELERWKKGEQIRLKSETVAALIAEWIGNPDDQRTLNKLTFEAYLWLPSDILKLLTKTLTSSPTAPNARQVLWQVRKHLLEDDSFPEHEIVIFKQEHAKNAFQKRMSEAFSVRPAGSSQLGAKGTRGKAPQG